MVDKLPAAPTHIQINFYRMNYGTFEYLILKRVDSEEDFWQSVTAQVKEGGDIGFTVKQAAANQVGIHSFKRLSEEMYSYEWYTPHGQRGRDIVFAAEVTPDTALDIDTSKYSSFQWLPFEQAVQHIKWNGAKDALRDLHKFLESKKLSNPEYWPRHEAGLYSTASKPNDARQLATGQGQSRGNPYGTNAPKRLPDRPEQSHESQTDDEKEINTGEWFL
jgi:hypothetical protein